jgi:RNA polymerase sigma-70 factor (ECF subfamily)
MASGARGDLLDTLTPSDLPDDDPSLLLVEKIQKGIDREDSCSKLHELHYRKVIAFFRRKGFSAEESQDLTQDTFSRVFKAIDTFRREARFERWLFEIAANIFRNKLRSQGADKRDGVDLPIDPPPEDEGSSRSIELPSNEPDALDELMKREREDALRKALQELPDQMRKCCVLRYERGLKYQEIATVMKISIETVKAHLHQARKRLIEKLGGGSPGEGPKGGDRP